MLSLLQGRCRPIGLCYGLLPGPQEPVPLQQPRSRTLLHATEAQARAELIDPALVAAGWDVNDPDRVGREIPVDGFDPAAW